MSQAEKVGWCRINSKAAFFILKEAAVHVTDGGKIITIATALLGAFTGFYTSYAGSKAPVEHFTRCAHYVKEFHCITLSLLTSSGAYAKSYNPPKPSSSTSRMARVAVSP